MEEQSAVFALKYEGKPREISAETLLNTLAGVSSMAQQAAQDFGGQRVEIRVRAPEPGSFLLDLVIDPSAASGVMAGVGEGVKVASAVVGMIAAFLAVRKHLKKEEPPAPQDIGGGQVSISNPQGSKINVDNRTYKLYVENAEIAFQLGRFFDALDRDERVTGLALLDEKKNEMFRAERSEFKALAEPVERVETGEKKEVVTTRVTLPIHKVCFKKGKRWQFIHQSMIVGAVIADEAFMDRVESRAESFASGDLLDMELRIEREKDPASLAFVNVRHTVVRVYGHIQAPIQGKLPVGPKP